MFDVVYSQLLMCFQFSVGFQLVYNKVFSTAHCKTKSAEVDAALSLGRSFDFVVSSVVVSSVTKEAQGTQPDHIPPPKVREEV